MFKKNNNSDKVDAYEKITATIISLLEKGVSPWSRPWNKKDELPIRLSNKKAYKGVNIFILIMTAMFSGYKSRYWGSFKEIQKLGGCVRKGEKGTPVVFWTIFEKLDKETGKTSKIPFLKYSVVFNLDQADGIPENKMPKDENEAIETIEFTPLESAENIINNWNDCPPIKHHGNRAYFSPRENRIGMPEKETFHSVEEYYKVLFHEVGHSTGLPLKRFRPDEHMVFGDNEYSLEELVAEMSSVFLCSEAGFSEESMHIENSAAYLQGWIKAFKNDKKLLVSAASKAQKAVSLILGTDKEISDTDSSETPESEEQLAVND